METISLLLAGSQGQATPTHTERERENFFVQAHHKMGTAGTWANQNKTKYRSQRVMDAISRTAFNSSTDSLFPVHSIRIDRNHQEDHLQLVGDSFLSLSRASKYWSPADRLCRQFRSFQLLATLGLLGVPVSR